MSCFTVGVAGGTGSGKTTLTRALLDRFSGQSSVVFMDNYYKDQSHLTWDERVVTNYDAPEAFDVELMAEHLRQLRAGHAIDCPVYNFAEHNRAAETIRVEPSPVLVIEGILLFALPELTEQLDLKLFVDTDADVRILRRIQRDVVERGRSLASVEEQYLKTVKPMHELYVDPSKRSADLIIPEGGRNIVALDTLINRIEREVS
ncbi:uridine kinase [Brevibacterium sp. HMSC08F02]|uniref:uridine kinase n=1 Tax=Brevibacterium TaxID=1696 RepID=UPI0002F65C42|nr:MULTISPECIES: uridine kinase [Brevibacterium]MCG7300680.1 uridine kinase [Brevibacterium ravenspurgense]OFT26039.1 uridine kinase [Brevibacterium sp. HMSC08F02]